VRESSPLGPGPEGFRDPVLMIAGTQAVETPSELGPGRAPAWSANGTAIAAIAPTEEGETIVVYGVPGGPRETSAPSDERWSMIGWQDDDIVAIGSTSGVVAIPGDGGPVHAFRLAPSAIWGVSPIEDTFVSVGPDGGSIARADGRVVIDIDGALGDGAWSWDGGAIGTVVIGDGASTQLVLIDSDSGDTTELDEGRGAQGNVVWAEDGQTFAFVQVDPDQRTRLEALVCSIDATCEPAFSWGRGVTLLGFR
jgi:Tol biopolymer transport system component